MSPDVRAGVTVEVAVGSNVVSRQEHLQKGKFALISDSSPLSLVYVPSLAFSPPAHTNH
jgi:hypothetical protein